MGNNIFLVQNKGKNDLRNMKLAISTNDLEEVQGWNYIYKDINTRCARLKICELIKQTQN